MLRRISLTALLMMLVCLLAASHATAGRIDVDGGVDVVNRYVWRGLEFGDAPAIQPSLALSSKCGFELGVWGSYATGNNDPNVDATFAELDTYLSYTHQFPGSVAITAVVTDYYFPNDAKLGNYNDYDDPDGAGAHTIEIGFGIAGPDAYPFSLFGFYNVYNDAGNNAYFQLNYTTDVNSTNLDFFIGATTGSEDNPGYYATDDFAVTNIGVTASKDIPVTSSFALPVFMTYQINPEEEKAWLLFGFSL